jgi:hypothetical protein
MPEGNGFIIFSGETVIGKMEWYYNEVIAGET